MGIHIADRVVSLCEEFSDWVLYDDKYKSIVINIKEDLFPTLKQELKKFNFKIIHCYEMSETCTVTCVFIKRN